MALISPSYCTIICRFWFSGRDMIPSSFVSNNSILSGLRVSPFGSSKYGFVCHHTCRVNPERLCLQLDFSDVCSKKAKIIRSQPETARHLIEPVEYSREEKGFTVLISARNYALIGMDLREHEVLKSVIKYLDLDCSSPTFILSEVVLTYIADLQ